ncbi:Methyltransferase domain-containing protein [Haladaptatus litoreus]|uniref:Methyltransferase domain-containing protein n=1 Tax=Haladaptatus litoreus TaxID=553468 RepID=A0A1N6Y832_9EURY|nr:class I SAM-dependent methyltransferase [Haladaptatus litoreus]SIR10795.1 Methyltransferase domain-containing protein [Haladaptatus litoreus]
MTDSTFDLRADEGLEVGKLAEQATPNEPFVSGADFWDDPYISEQLLDAHLDPERNAASRPHDRIDAEVEWLVSELSLDEGDRILDLGCGPGLYCERLHDYGLDVTGIDLSDTALDYAKTRAEETGRDITYRHEDYRNLSDESKFDAAILVNFDFGTFANDDRNSILRSVHTALAPVGRFAFDVYTERNWTATDIGTEWSVQEGAGFWRPVPHLVLSETVPFPDSGVHLDQHFVIEESGEASVYRFWERYYEPDGLRSFLFEHDFVVDEIWEDFRGTSYSDESASISVVAHRN